MDEKEMLALKSLSFVDLEQILKFRGPNGLVQHSPLFKDAIMVNIGVLFLATGVPLMITASIAISMYNEYKTIQDSTTLEKENNFSSLNSAQIFFLVLAIASIVVGIVFVCWNAGRRSKAEILAVQEYGVDTINKFMDNTG